MQTGRFISKLQNDILVYYQTRGAEDLLNKTNLEAVWNTDTPGEYPHKFPDDMAIALTKVTLDFDSGGRPVPIHDTIVIKFDLSDRMAMLSNMEPSLLPKMKEWQEKNGTDKALADVKIE